MHRQRQFFAILFAIGILFPATAQACRYWGNQTPLLHETLPVLPEGAIAAEVEITTLASTPDQPVFEARIISMIVGDFAGTRLQVGPRAISSCDSFPSLGERGIAVGYVLATSDEELVIDLIRAPSLIEQLQQSRRQNEGANPP